MESDIVTFFLYKKVAKFDLVIKYVAVKPGSSFGQTMMGLGPQCYIPKFMEIGPLVPEKIFKGFYHIWVWQISWSCHQHQIIKF